MREPYMKTEIFRSRAPLRISFAGGGTDISPYPEMFGGAVISATIDMYCYTSINLLEKNIIKIHSKDFEFTEVIKKDQELKTKGKLELIFSILRNLKVRPKNGIELTLYTDAKIGSGLGASSGLSVALIGNLLRIFKIHKTPYEIADLAYKIERIECGIKGGYQDQYSATFGGFNFIEFKKNRVTVNPLRLRNDIIDEMIGNFILCDTRVVRKNRIYDKIIRAQSNKAKKNDSSTQVLHNIKTLTYEMKDALMKGNMNDFAELLHQGWVEKQKITSDISTKKIQKLYDTARKSGAKGGKLLGAGGGGYMLLYCDIDKKIDVSKALEKAGTDIVKFNFDKSGLVTWKVKNGIVC